MTTNPPPYIHRLLPVRWCLRALTSNGWTYLDTQTIGGHRAYSMIAPDGLGVYLSTYGLRRMASKFLPRDNDRKWFPENPEKLVDTASIV